MNRCFYTQSFKASRLASLRRAASLAASSQMSLRIAFAVIACMAHVSFTQAHEPNRECQSVLPRVDLIGPLGSGLAPGHRRKYNRPSYWEGKIAYKIAPSSQEAMAWHRAEHAGAYDDPKKCMRLEQHYFYPKPWEVLRVGQRASVLQPAQPMEPISNGMNAEPETTDQDAESPAPSLEAPLDSESLELESIELEDLKPVPIEGLIEETTSLAEPEVAPLSLAHVMESELIQ